jgi:hypothetical protein
MSSPASTRNARHKPDGSHATADEGMAGFQRDDKGTEMRSLIGLPIHRYPHPNCYRCKVGAFRNAGVSAEISSVPQSAAPLTFFTVEVNTGQGLWGSTPR